MDVDVGTSAGGGAVEVLASVGLGTDVETNVSVADSSRALSGIGETAGAMTGTGVGCDGLDDGGAFWPTSLATRRTVSLAWPKDFGPPVLHHHTATPPTINPNKKRASIHPLPPFWAGRGTGIGAGRGRGLYHGLATLADPAGIRCALRRKTRRYRQGDDCRNAIGAVESSSQTPTTCGGRTGDDPVMAGRLFHPTL